MKETIKQLITKEHLELKALIEDNNRIARQALNINLVDYFKDGNFAQDLVEAC